MLRETDKRTGLIGRFAGCFTDYRDQSRIEFSVERALRQRVFGVALGYEDVNDHDFLRFDPLLAVAMDIEDPTGQKRKRESDRGKPLAGKSTLNRLELSAAQGGRDDRYKRIHAHFKEIEELFVWHFLESHSEAPEEIVLDLDATDDPLHGKQEGRFFHGYYGHYCYLPLYIFCDDFLLCAKLRPSNIDGAAGALEEVMRIVEQIRTRWTSTRIILRADSGFARDPLMTCVKRTVSTSSSGSPAMKDLPTNSPRNCR